MWGEGSVSCLIIRTDYPGWQRSARAGLVAGCGAPGRRMVTGDCPECLPVPPAPTLRSRSRVSAWEHGETEVSSRLHRASPSHLSISGQPGPALNISSSMTHFLEKMIITNHKKSDEKEENGWGYLGLSRWSGEMVNVPHWQPSIIIKIPWLSLHCHYPTLYRLGNQKRFIVSL